MRIVFMGSAGIACASLQALLDTPDCEIAGVVTQPERPAGRNRKNTACAASAFAAARGVEIFAPVNVNHPESVARIRNWRPDLGVVVAYGQILRRALLDLPPLGFINVHTSLLPKYRGAAPIQRAVANGDSVTGVTIMQMDEGMDTGDILAQHTVPIGETDTSVEVHDRLASAGAELLMSVLADIRAGRAQRTPQDHAQATLAPKLTKAEGRLDWTLPAQRLFNQIRGFTPWPGCFCEYECGGVHALRVLEAKPEATAAQAPPGAVVETARGPLVACGEGALRLIRVQPEGGKAMDATAFLCGRPLRAGDRFL